jgi:hypothetical protein
MVRATDKQWAYGLKWLISASSQYQLTYLTECYRMITQNMLMYLWVARLGAEGLRNRSWSSDRNKKFLSYSKCPDWPYDPPIVVTIITITTTVIILVLQPGSSHSRPSDASELQSVRCLGFPVVNYNALTSSSALSFHLVGDRPTLLVPSGFVNVISELY